MIASSSPNVAIYTIIAIVLVCVTTLLFLYFYYQGSDLNDILPKMTPLSPLSNVGMPDDIFKRVLASSGSTVMGFFRLLDGDRTMSYQKDTGPQQFVPLLQVENNWAVEISRSPIENHGTTARFRVKVKNAAMQIVEEVIELPSLPYQKWVFIAVLRDGRRFDILYDNRIVASHRLAHYPVAISSPLSVGHKTLNGSVIHVMVASGRLSPSEVERKRLQFVDTNGAIYEDHAINVSFPKPILPLFGDCPPGFPCEPVTKPPRDNLLRWTSPYA